ncbi:glycosyltransferase [Paenibacillus sp. ACRRX]|uniref:glycosyltransferase n=1 Tax=Paenibacillus sp. ACRRX TaxID=2918206 RepID=UPI001EF71940|nr:glycosyltransferase [Paenibacillus sp. ACRRX]MCG7409920.1 glycosyltransferase [Paenibacillus sp. ACRRX]
MRVALLTDTYWPELNGAARTLKRWTQYLCKHHVPVRVIAPKPQHPLKNEWSVNRVFSIPFAVYPDCRFALPNPSWIGRQLDRFNPSIIHVATPFSLGLIGVRYARSRGIPLVASYHTHFDQYLKFYHLESLEMLLWNICAGFIEIAKLFMPHLPIQRECLKPRAGIGCTFGLGELMRNYLSR